MAFQDQQSKAVIGRKQYEKKATGVLNVHGCLRGFDEARGAIFLATSK